jgi:hypothetical protein
MLAQTVMGEAARFADRDALLLLAALTVVSGLLARPLSRRLQRSYVGTSAALVATAVILAATVLPRSSLGYGWYPLNALDWVTSGSWRGAVDPRSAQWLLNVVLFAPAGAAWALIARRTWIPIFGLVAFSALIESFQHGFTARSGDPADLLANALGAALGACAAAWVPRPTDRAAGEPWSWRAAIIPLATVAAVVLLAFVGIRIGANAEQAQLRDQLAQELPADWDELNTYFVDIDGDAPRYLELLNATAVFPDYLGRSQSTESIRGRYTLEFFGAIRCVIVVWTPDGRSFENDEGDICTTFVEHVP